MKKIAILGSTGSIGTQTLEVIKEHSDLFEVEVLTGNSNVQLLIQQALEFQPNAVVIADEAHYITLKDALADTDIKVFAGYQSLCSIVEMDTIDMVLTALVGYAGLLPTIKAIEAGKPIALANKETLVVAGELITKLASENGVNIYPVDSEHAAIFQCLNGEFQNKIEKIYLTASGGPFRGKDVSFLEKVSPEQALKHPNWEMGAKITIDSATLMNKGLEVIEAKWLFNLKKEQIDVIVHPQSIVHSMVQFEDGSLKAQMGLPDMKLPILYALAYPNRIKTSFPRFSFIDYPQLTFEQPNIKIFKNLQLAYDAMEYGGNMPCILNGANEIAVHAFLKKKIGFLDISRVIEICMGKCAFIKSPNLTDYISSDEEARNITNDIINNNFYIK